MPSSPKGPCRIGNTTSTGIAVTVPSGWDTTSSLVAGEVGNAIRVPLSGTVGSAPSRIVHCAGSSDCSVKAPSWVIPIGTRSYSARSTTSMMPPAVTQLISCSLERPPKSTATVVLGMGVPSGIVGTGVPS